MDLNTYMRLIEPAMQLVVKKHEDYNTGVKLEEYFPFGETSYVQIIHMKTLRLRSLLGRQANFESAEDTLRDMINYAVFYLHFLEQQRAK